jgi:hypothetical protein
MTLPAVSYASHRPALAWLGGAGGILLLLVASLLLGALVAGLTQLGVLAPGAMGWGAWAVDAGAHGALMVSGFLGTVVSLERAVSAKLRWALVVPFVSGAAGIAMAGGPSAAAAWLAVIAATLFVGVNLFIVASRFHAAAVLRLLGALGWLIGCLLMAKGTTGGAAAWFSFLLLTIVAERVEMTRMTQRASRAMRVLAPVVFCLLGAALAAVHDDWQMAAGLIFGLALVALAVWLMWFDTARHSLKRHGLGRFTAVAVLGAGVWLAVAGASWAATAVGWPLRDAALHALGLGFVFSMLMGHAPVILPAMARVRVVVGVWFYVPLVALHASLALRLLGGLQNVALRQWGGWLGALAIALYLVAMAAGALAWRIRYGASRAREYVD